MLSRRGLLIGGVLGVGAGAGAAGAGWWCRRSGGVQPSLLSAGVVVGPDGVTYPLAPEAACAYVPGTRVVASVAEAERLGIGMARDAGRLDTVVQAARDVVAQATLPGGRWGELAQLALADLLALTGPNLAPTSVPAASPQSTPAPGAPPVVYPSGGVVAAPVSIWRYIWPRDAAFAAAAYSAVGLPEQAVAVLECLTTFQNDAVARLAPQAGSTWARARGRGPSRAASILQARYAADGTTPDDRPAQLDGVGWLMWAAGRLAADAAGAGTSPGRIAQLLSPVLPALARSRAHLMWLTGGPGHLPPASPDYWEVRERWLTLGVAAPVLLGLEAAASLEEAGLLDAGTDGAGATRQRAVQVRRAIEAAWAPTWGRHAGDDDVDAALACVAPPFTAALDGVVPVRVGAAARMRRAAGGLAPGSRWKDDGVSWTPETALMAWSARSLAQSAGAVRAGGGSAGAGTAGEGTVVTDAVGAAQRQVLGREAEELLTWLEAVRTSAGAVPEKVRADGQPAGPAPLAWTNALILLALAEEAD